MKNSAALQLAVAAALGLFSMLLGGCASDRWFKLRGVVRCAPSECNEPRELGDVEVRLKLVEGAKEWELGCARTDAAGRYDIWRLGPPSWESRMFLEFAKPNFEMAEVALATKTGAPGTVCPEKKAGVGIGSYCQIVDVELRKQQ